MKKWLRLRHFAPVFAVLVGGICVTVSVWYLLFASENRASGLEFSGRSSNQAIILQSGINEYWDRLYAVRALFDSSSKGVTREEFENFSNSLLAGRSAILNIAWIPRVRHEDRAAHELAAARDGITDYHIRAVAPDGRLPLSPVRDEYFPKFYSTEARTSPVYGLDLNDGDMRARVVARIRDGDALSISPPLMLHIGEGDRRGFWAGVPVYGRDLPHETLEDRRRNITGIVQGVFQVGVMIDTILAGVTTPVRIYLFAPDAAGHDLSIYTMSRLADGMIEARSQADLAGEMHASFPLNFGDVPWKLVVTPEPEDLAFTRHRSSSILLLSGLLLSGGLTLFVWVLRRGGRKLAIANDNLEAANDKFETQNSRFDAALNNMAQGLMMFNGVGKLTASNQRVAELFGVPWWRWKISALGMTIPQAMQFAYGLTKVTRENEAQIIAQLQAILVTGKTGTIVFERADGRTLSATCAPITDGGFVVTFDDITERRRTESKISHLAHYDVLTDLPNRALFYEKMEELLSRGSQGGAFAVLSLDLDHFKSVNDTLGHPVGDKLLQAVAERMRGCIRETDMVARLGGDEFAILQGTLDQPTDTSGLAIRLIEAVSAPYRIDGHQIMLGTSVGIAMAPGDGTTADQLMKNADLALYRCKADGGGRHRFFETQMDADREERCALELDLRKALLNGEFTLNYQPVVDLKTGKITACEALIRWYQPERGWVPPLKFIPIAEETGLIEAIGEWVLGEACAAATEWPDDITIAVNVSPVQLRNPGFLRTVIDALAKAGLPASRLELEITELVLIQDRDAAIAVLTQIKELGASIAMDDFGTGHSSLGYIRSFSFDRIKIDQSFIRDLPESKDSLAIIRAVVALGRSLGIVTTAEGVETQSQLEVLRAEGCSEVQGYLFSRPKCAQETKMLLALLAREAKAAAA